MNKAYPVVLYPKNILKFLAIAPTPVISSYQSTANHAAGAKITHKISWFVLPKWQLIGAVVVGIIIAWSLAFLSPFWLIATVWVVILLGVLSIEILKSKKQPFKRQKIIPSNKFNRLSAWKPEMSLQSTTRFQQLSKLLSGCVMSSIGMGSAQEGVSEKAFKQILQRFFPHVMQGIQFQNLDLSISYSADFAFIHPSGFSIDIEIDEPLVGNTKEPHYCTDSGKDDIRNQFFLKGNWTVIRFSEK